MKINLNSIANVLIILVLAMFVARYFYMKPKFVNGEKAPTFSAKLDDGQNFQLESLRGDYVLLDFWGSWCGPCRAESPDMVKLYQKYKDQDFKDAEGFEIVSVGIERNQASWRRAIQSDGLAWPYHILDISTSMKFFNGKIADLYSIKQIPTKFLLNPQGVIIGVNQSPGQVDRFLQKRAN